MSPIVKKKPEKEKMPSKVILFLLTLLCICLMILTYTCKMPDTIINNVAGVIIVPFEKGLTTISGFFIQKKDNMKSYKELLAENKELRSKLEELNNENTLLLQDKYELTSLRELYKLDNMYSDYDKVAARIISSDSNNWFDSFIIDKGTDDGIKVDMNVMAGSGLVGRVTRSGKNWAKVTTIISDESNVSGLILHSQDNIIIKGDMSLINQGYINYQNLVDKDDIVAKGDKIVTSNISDKYLPGILIGYISTVEIDSNNMTKSGVLIPAVDFSHLSEVLVIKEIKDNYEF